LLLNLVVQSLLDLIVNIHASLAIGCLQLQGYILSLDVEEELLALGLPLALLLGLNSILLGLNVVDLTRIPASNNFLCNHTEHVRFKFSSSKLNEC